MAESVELKRRIISKIKEEWGDADKGWDWKERSWWDEEGLAENMFAKLCISENWGCMFRGYTTIGGKDFIIRHFYFDYEESREDTICAMVTCDKNDNFIDIEFEKQ